MKDKIDQNILQLNSMTTAILSVKIDEHLKKEAQELASKLGINISTVVKAKLSEFVRSKSLNISLEETPSEELKSIIKKSKKEEKSPIFTNAKDAIKWLEK